MNIENVINLLSNRDKFVKLPKEHIHYNYFVQQTYDLKKLGFTPISADDFIEKITTSKNIKLLLDNLKNVKIEYIYGSEGHGIKHNIRVALFSFYLANELKLNDRNTTLALYGALYHDIGRVNDEEDAKHGMRSAKELDKLGLDVTKEEMKMLKTAIISHSIPDKDFAKVAKKMKVENMEDCTMLFKILKDADGLDRVRLRYPCVGYDFLRNDISKRLVPFAYSLEYNLGGRFNAIKRESSK